MKFTKTKNLGFLLTFLSALAISLATYLSYFAIGNCFGPYHDTLIYSFPPRVFISSAIRLGIFPLWDQWSSGGMSLSSGISTVQSAFSPLILLFSLFGTYTIKTLMVEMLSVQFLCFVGMFFWLKEYSNKWIAVYGAFCFSLSAPILGTLANYDVLVTMSLMPAVAYGIRKVFHGSIAHVGLLPLLLYLIFTTGYLGMNILFLEVIIVYCFLESFFTLTKQKILLFFLAIVLFLGLTNFVLLESWHYTDLNYSQFRKENFDPFSGSGGLDSLYTTIFPNIRLLYSTFYNEAHPPFIPLNHLLPAPGVTGTIYFGLVNLIFIFYALLNKKSRRLSILLMLFVVLTFFLTLSNQYFIGRFLTQIVPYLGKIRWHEWFNVLTVFFAITLTCVGIFSFSKNLGHKSSLRTFFIGSLLLLLVTFFIIVSSIPIKTYLYLPQLVSLLAIILSVVFFYFSHNKLFKRKNLLLLIIGIAVLEITVQSRSYVTYRDQWGNCDVVTTLTNLYKKLAFDGFPIRENKRVPATYNLQIIAKAPSYDGMYSIKDAKIQKLEKLGREKYVRLMENIFYFANQNNQPIFPKDSLIEIIKFHPNRIEVFVNNPKDNQQIVWASPYTPFWKLYINDKPSLTHENDYGLTKFSINKGDNNVALVYQPPYLLPSLFIMLVSFAISLFLIIHLAHCHSRETCPRPRSRSRNPVLDLDSRSGRE